MLVLYGRRRPALRESSVLLLRLCRKCAAATAACKVLSPQSKHKLSAGHAGGGLGHCPSLLLYSNTERQGTSEASHVLLAGLQRGPKGGDHGDSQPKRLDE